MRICFIAPANNYHTKKWVNWFLRRGHEIHVVSFIEDEIPGATVHFIDTGALPEDGDASKLKYLIHAKELKRIVDIIKPDIVNVHYATSYGTVAAMSGIKPYILSVWGSDIYDFPKKSALHKAMLKYSLRKANLLFSTSRAMAKEGTKYTNKKFEITPFGVDMTLFNPNKRTRQHHVPTFKIGMIVTKDEFFIIKYIVQALGIISRKCDEVDVETIIHGSTLNIDYYRKLAVDLGVSNRVRFSSSVNQVRAADEWANMNVMIIPSVLSSTLDGVADKAQLRECPMIFSNIDELSGTLSSDWSNTTNKTINEQYFVDLILYFYNNYLIKVWTTNDTKFSNEAISLSGSLFNTYNYIEHYADALLISIEIKQRQDFIVGTVKCLSDKYGISDILHAVKMARANGLNSIKLRIAGTGPQEDEYKNLAKRLGIGDITTWLGFINQEQVAKEWANMDVAIIPSTLESESFGVSAVEAQACGTAVIISDIPGLMEATKPGETSLVVHRNSPVEIAEAITLLANDCSKRNALANAGKEYVNNKYEINSCFENVERLFNTI